MLVTIHSNYHIQNTIALKIKKQNKNGATYIQFEQFGADNVANLLVEGDDDDEGGGNESPAPADGSPHHEPGQVKDVSAEQGVD